MCLERGPHDMGVSIQPLSQEITKKDVVLILLLPAWTKCALAQQQVSACPQSSLVWKTENDVALLSQSTVFACWKH